MSDSDSVKKTKVLVYGKMGEDLASLDKERLLACIQHDPDFAFSRIALKNLHGLFKEIKKSKPDDDLKEKVMKQVKLSHDFREFADFFREDMDELSRGSAIMGELKQMEGKLARLKKDKADLEADILEELDDMG